MATTTIRPSLELDLLFQLSWASHALATEQTAALAKLGITPRGHCVLYKAARIGALTQSQLAEVCGLDKTTMVVLMDKLERAGLAVRKPSSEDRRARIISVTQKGRRLVARANDIVARVQEDVLAALPAELRDAFVDGLGQLVRGRLSAFAACEQPPRRRVPQPSRPG